MRLNNLTMTILSALIVVTTIKCTTTPKAPTRYDTWKESVFVADHITPAMLNSSPGGLCPHYSNVDHMKFWDAFVRSVVSAESSFNPESWMREAQGIDPVTGEVTKSEGYLQLSYKDTLHQFYKNLPEVKEISWAKKNLRDPHVNLAAGLAIMDERIRRTGPDVVTALAPYWSTIGNHETKLDKNLKAWIPECFQ